MSKLSTWYTSINGAWKAAALIAAIFGAGITTGAAAGGLTKMPARVIALEQRADSLTNQLSDIRRDVAELRKSNRIQLCMQIAERQHTDWRECLK